MRGFFDSASYLTCPIFLLRQAEPLLNGGECSSILSKALLHKFKASFKALLKEISSVPVPVGVSLWRERGEQRAQLGTCMKSPALHNQALEAVQGAIILY